MPAGVQIVGSHGIVQIDETYKNYHLTASGIGALNGGNEPPYFWTGLTCLLERIEHAAITTTSLIAIKTPLPLGVIAKAAGHFDVMGEAMDFGAGTQYDFDWYCFDTDPPDATAGFGLRVYNAAGDVTFNSEYPPMRVLGNFTVAAPPYDGTVGTDFNTGYSPPGGKSVAYITGIHPRRTWSGEGGGPGAQPNSVRIKLVRGSSPVLAREHQYLTFLGGQNFDSGGRPGFVLAVDVTNL